MTNKFQLPEDLQNATRAEWQGLVEKALKGKTIDQALVTKTADEILIQPLYVKDDEGASKGAVSIESNAPHASERPWDIIDLIDIPDLTQANAHIKQALEGGASGLWLSINQDIPYGAAALALETQADYKTVLDGVDLSSSALYFSNGQNSLVNAAMFSTWAKENETRAPKTGSFGFAPLGLYAATNKLSSDYSEMVAPFVDAAIALRETGSRLNAFTASGRIWQQAGATEAMELALTLSEYTAYARALEAAGEELPAAFATIDISLAANSDVFLVTAKLRAMRLLVEKVKAASNAASAPTRIMAEMSWLDMTSTDPEVNMLRATAATVASGLGNADALLLLPFSTTHGVANSAARRLALNTQIIAQEESHIGKVEDPLAGSWYIETLTEELAEKAWAIFRDIEKDGGLSAALNSGVIKELITAARNEAIAAIATGKREITGTTVFPNIDEKPPAIIAPVTKAELSDETADISNLPEPATGALFKALQSSLSAGTKVSALSNALVPQTAEGDFLPTVSTRLVSDIEALRQVSDTALKATGKRPSVYLCNLGTAADFTARATWAKSFFETGGIKAESSAGVGSDDEAVKEFQQSGAAIVCLCSTDEKYEQQALSIAAALRDAGAKAVYLVARPNMVEKLGEGAKEAFHTLLFKGKDITATLSEAHSIISGNQS